MLNTKFKNYTIYYNFLNALAKELTRFYYKKLDKPFKVINKAKSIYLLSKQLIEKHKGKVPKNFDDLNALPGVGRKTASVV